MADKFINETGLAAIRDWAKAKFALDADLDTLNDKVDDIIAEGGEPNVIETVKVNGTALTPVNKAVDVTVPEDLSDLTNTGQDPYAKASDVPTATSDLTNDGDGTSNFATESYVDQNGGKIDVIKVNGTTQTITNKAVDIAVPEDLSDLTNTDADPYAKMSDVESATVGALKPKGSVTFANLPALTAANLNNMYNVSDEFTTTADFTEGAGHKHPAGTNVAIVNTGTEQSPVYKYDAMVGSVDLSAYWTSTAGQNNTLNAMTVAEINAILEPVTP